MSEVLREVHVVAHDSEGTSGWWWYPTRDRAREAYEQEIGIWAGDAHVRLLRKNIPLFFDNDETTDWIQNADTERDFADWEVLERTGPMPSGMTDPHHKETPSMSTDQTPETNLQAAGYTYKAESYCLHHALFNLERNMNHPLFDVHVLSAVIDNEEIILEIAAEHMEIDHRNPYSYDSDVFPKPFTEEQAEPGDFCSDCLIRFSDGAQLIPWTVLGIELEDGRLCFTHILAGHVGKAVGPCFTEEEDGIKRWVAQVLAPTQKEAITAVEELEYTDEPE